MTAARMKKRARVLHLVCQGIAREIANGTPRMRAYGLGCSRYNRSLLARGRGKLTVAAIRWEFARWKLVPSPSCFLGPWGQGRSRMIKPAQALEWTRRAVASRQSVAELYRQLQSEIGPLNFSLSTLHHAMPGRALQEVRRSRVRLEKAEQAALASLEAKARRGHE